MISVSDLNAFEDCVSLYRPFFAIGPDGAVEAISFLLRPGKRFSAIEAHPSTELTDGWPEVAGVGTCDFCCYRLLSVDIIPYQRLGKHA